jgi:hypothetical protein
MSKHYFSCPGWPDADVIKSALRHVMPNFCVLYPVQSVDHVVHLGASECET